MKKSNDPLISFLLVRSIVPLNWEIVYSMYSLFSTVHRVSVTKGCLYIFTLNVIITLLNMKQYIPSSVRYVHTIVFNVPSEHI